MGRNIATDATASFAQGARRASKVALATAAAKWETNVAAINAAAAVGGAATRKWGSEWFDGQPELDPTKNTLKKIGKIDPTKNTLGAWGGD
jgi:hypothetical protein